MSDKGKIVGLEPTSGKEAIIDMLVRAADKAETSGSANRAILILAHIDKQKTTWVDIETAGALHSTIDTVGLLELAKTQVLFRSQDG